MDQLYNLLGNDFHFVVTLLSDQEYMKGGGDYSNRPYCLCALKISPHIQKLCVFP